jgi:hypothetical protein
MICCGSALNILSKTDIAAGKYDADVAHEKKRGVICAGFPLCLADRRNKHCLVFWLEEYWTPVPGIGHASGGSGNASSRRRGYYRGHLPERHRGRFGKRHLLKNGAYGRPMLSILIVDDHPVVREGLRHILTEEFEGVVIAEARSHLSLPMVQCVTPGQGFLEERIYLGSIPILELLEQFAD